MHSALVQELVDLRRRDTEVCVPAFRRHRIRSTASVRERPAETAPEIGEIAGPWVDPGDTMSAASAVQVRLREAIVRRNHRSARTEVTGCVEIDWARSKELAVKRIGRGVLRIEGSSPKPARISIGIDGLAFTVAVSPGSQPSEAIAERLSSHYLTEIIVESHDSFLVVLTGLAPILR